MESETNLKAPYASTENVIRVLEKVYHSGVGPQIDGAFLKQLGIGDTMISRTLQALRYLTFIDDNGNVQPVLRQFMQANQEQRQALMQDILRASYAVIFRAVEPTTDDRAKVWTAFKVMEPSKQWDRMVTLFLGLCKYAGMDVKDAPANRPAKAPAISKNGQTKPNAARRKGAELPPAQTQTQLALPGSTMPKRLDPALGSIVDKVGDLETMDDLEAWYSMFKAAFKFVKNIRTE